MFNTPYELSQHSSGCAFEKMKIEDIIEEVETSNQEVDVIKPYECQKCELRFNRKNALLSHEKLHILKKSPKSKSPKISKAVQLTNGSTNETEMKIENSHKFPCNECDKMFLTKQKMLRHQYIHRTKLFNCEICAKYFKQKAELNEHRLQEHTEYTKYVCDRCGKSFASRQGRWEHLKTHSTDHFYNCNDCMKKFTSRQGYMIHLRTHNDERPFACT